MGGCGGLEITDFGQFLLWEGVAVMKELILTVPFLGECGGLERTDFNSFYILGGCGGLERTHFNSFYSFFWEGVVVLKELIFNSFYFERVWWSLILKFLTERIIFNSFYFGSGVVGRVS